MERDRAWGREGGGRQEDWISKVLSLTRTPMRRRSDCARGGKYFSQWAGSVKSLISSSDSPSDDMICHWYFRPPVLACTLPCNQPHFMKSHHQPCMSSSSLHEITSSALYDTIITSWNYIISLMVISLYAIIITSWKSHHTPYGYMLPLSLHENHTTDLMLICHHHHFMKITYRPYVDMLSSLYVIITLWKSHHRLYGYMLPSRCNSSDHLHTLTWMYFLTSHNNVSSS